MGSKLDAFLKYIPQWLIHKDNSQPYYRERNVKKTLYKQGNEIKTLREVGKKNRADLEAMILSLEEKIEGGASLARAQEVYAGLLKAANENPLIREQITSAEVSHSLDKMTLYLLSHPEFRDRLTDLYNAQQKHVEAQTKLEERRQKQMRRTVRVVGTTIVATTLAIGATYIGKGYYDRKYVGETLDSMKLKIEKVSEQQGSDKEAKMKTDAQTLLRIASLETLVEKKTATLAEDISNTIAKAGNYELETEKRLKQTQTEIKKINDEKIKDLEKLQKIIIKQETRVQQLEEENKTIKENQKKLEKEQTPFTYSILN